MYRIIATGHIYSPYHYYTATEYDLSVVLSADYCSTYGRFSCSTLDDKQDGVMLYVFITSAMKYENGDSTRGIAPLAGVCASGRPCVVARISYATGLPHNGECKTRRYNLPKIWGRRLIELY